MTLLNRSQYFVPFNQQLPTAHSSIPTHNDHDDFSVYDATFYSDALAFLQHPHARWWEQSSRAATNPNTSIPLLHHPTPSPLNSAISGTSTTTTDWPMYMATPHNMVESGARYGQGLRRTRSHQRTPSASTIASNGPASPYVRNSSYPHIANTDHPPNSPGQLADRAIFSKNLPTPSQTPTDSSFADSTNPIIHTPDAHLAMKGFGIDHHASDDFPADLAPSRQSMSSYGNDSPATPQSDAGDMDIRSQPARTNGEIALVHGEDETAAYLYFDGTDFRPMNPHVQLFRTESQAYQDELYNPNTMYTASSKPATKTSAEFLSPRRNPLTERLQTANLARSTSPTSFMTRERSPFREGSVLAPGQDWKSSALGTAAGMRQQQKREAEQAEYAQHRTPLQREATKTISPKDALLDYNDPEQTPLFQDNIPVGYKQHMGGTEQWPTNNTFFSQSSATFSGNLPTTGQDLSFRTATSADTYTTYPGFDFTVLPPTEEQQLQNQPYQANYPVAPKLESYPPSAEQTPDFPATLPSMETSISDAGIPPSSQDSGPTPIPQRPHDTRANTGTYTCTYHGCTQRFDSHNNLQRHKRDMHRTQREREGTSTSGTSSTSPRSTDSPAPSASSMTSSAILERNSQAGPHKCTRINPSTNKPCNTIFSRPYDLTRHEDTIHNNRKHKVRCPMCREEKTFSRNDALTRHMRVVHPEVEALGKRSRRGD